MRTLRVAILGATSQIARDLIATMVSEPPYELHLFARRPSEVHKWIESVGIENPASVADFREFGKSAYDAVLNFVGVGNPAKCLEIGNAIFDITHEFDRLALSYIQQNANCRYIFLSSGAVYGSDFVVPASQTSKAEVAINDFKPEHWYGAAKLAAECRHRALPGLAIYDLRVFSYFSSSQDMNSRFFMADILRAISGDELLFVSEENVIRDYLSPTDFRQLIDALLQSPPANAAIDCYTKAPIDKIHLLTIMRETFGLKYQIAESAALVNSTGSKFNYYSTNRRAAEFGYQPTMTSLDGIIRSTRLFFEAKKS